MGNSCKTYVLHCAQKGSYKMSFDETWAINAMAGVIQHDRALVMDDIESILKPLISANPTCMTAGMMDWLPVHPGPVYTSKAYPEFPGTVDYPLEDVINAVGHIYFNTSVAYAVGLAIHLKVKEIGLYGCDFTYPDTHVAESGRACVEFLLGIAGANGAKIVIAGDSTLLDASLTVGQKLYGYRDPLVIGRDEDGGRIKVRPATATAEPQPAHEQARPALKLQSDDEQEQRTA